MAFLNDIFFQGNSNRSETKICKTSSSFETSEGHQSNPKAEGCFRLCDHLSQERVQYPNRLHPLSIHLCCDWGPVVQWKVFLLHRCEQTRRRGVPVSVLHLSIQLDGS